jgi:hypothetical protein
MALAVAAFVWAAVTAIAGGIALDAGGLHVSSRDPLRPLVAGLVLLAAAGFLAGGVELRRGLARLAGVDRGPTAARIACVASLAVLVFSIAWNTRAAGGSDSSCYLLQAEAFAHGRVTLDASLDALPDAPPAVLSPTGFVPSPRPPHAPVPICGPGLGLMMALPFLLDRAAAFLIVPAFAALLVWLAFVLGRQLDDEVTGACAAILVACSPIVLYQAVQPMSDVPAAALWLAALTATLQRRPVLGGLCASLAVLTRANLALVVVPLAFLLPDWKTRLRFCLAALPAVAVAAALNVVRYGSPLASGYGSTGVLFSPAHVPPNLARYPRWLIATGTPFVLLWVLTPWWIVRHPDRRRSAGIAMLCVCLIVGTYLAYSVFDDWWYIRFLLPALPVAIVLSVAVALEAATVRSARSGAIGARRRAIVAAALAASLGTWYIHVARGRQVLDLQSLESRFVLTGRYAARALPPDAVVLAVQQSGSIRFHGGRMTIAWDAIPPDALDTTIARLIARGRAPYIAVEDEEVPRFRARFSAQRFGALDWPPSADVQARVRVRIFDVAGRAAYRSGAPIVTQYVR